MTSLFYKVDGTFFPIQLEFALSSVGRERKKRERTSGEERKKERKKEGKKERKRKKERKERKKGKNLDCILTRGRKYS